MAPLESADCKLFWVWKRGALWSKSSMLGLDVAQVFGMGQQVGWRHVKKKSIIYICKQQPERPSQHKQTTIADHDVWFLVRYVIHVEVKISRDFTGYVSGCCRLENRKVKEQLRQSNKAPLSKNKNKTKTLQVHRAALETSSGLMCQGIWVRAYTQLWFCPSHIFTFSAETVLIHQYWFSQHQQWDVPYTRLQGCFLLFYFKNLYFKSSNKVNNWGWK